MSKEKRKWVIITDQFKKFPMYTLMEELNSEQIGPPHTTLGGDCMFKSDAENNPRWFVEVTNNKIFNEVFDSVRFNCSDLKFDYREAACAAYYAMKAWQETNKTQKSGEEQTLMTLSEFYDKVNGKNGVKCIVMDDYYNTLFGKEVLLSWDTINDALYAWAYFESDPIPEDSKHGDWMRSETLVKEIEQ